MLDESLKTRLRICSEISFIRYVPHTIMLCQLKLPYLFNFSYDTKALNKHRLHVEEPDDLLFVNKFTDSSHKKITLGVQQLYIIGNILDI